MYKLSEKNRDIILKWLTEGEGTKLSYGSVSAVVKLLTGLEKVEDEKKEKEKPKT